MVADLAEPFIGKFADELDVGFRIRAGRVLVGPLVSIALVGLRMVFCPGNDLILVDADLPFFFLSFFYLFLHFFLSPPLSARC